MRKILLAIALFLSLFIAAQDETVKKLKTDAGKAIAKEAGDTIPKTWKTGGIFSLNFSQASLSNWAAGGDNFALAITSIINLHAFYKKEKISWDNTLDFNLGYLKTTSTGGRKNDDRLDLLSKYGYSIAPKWNVGALFNFRTQLFKGYTYPDNVKTFSSAFLSPAYILLSPGFDYKPDDHFSVFISPATARWLIVKDDSLSAKGLYGVQPGRHSIFEWGAFLSAGYIKDLNKIVSYKGRLDLFSNYKHNPQNVDLFMSNIFSVKLSKWLSASWSLDLIYDDDTRIFGKNGKSPALQVQSLIGAGILLKF
jgi:hypothetical protein